MSTPIFAQLARELGHPGRPARHATPESDSERTAEWVPDWSVALPVHGTGERRAG